MLEGLSSAMLQDQVVCDGDAIDEDVDEVGKLINQYEEEEGVWPVYYKSIFFVQESFFQDIDSLQNHGIVSKRCPLING